MAEFSSLEATKNRRKARSAFGSPATEPVAPQADARARLSGSEPGARKKKLKSFRLSDEFAEDLELEAIAMQRVAGRKVWTSSMLEAAWQVFKALDPATKEATVCRVMGVVAMPPKKQS